MKKVFYYDMGIGKIGISENGNGITEIGLASRLDASSMEIKETDLIKKAAKQLEEYLSGSRTEFDFPIDYEGTHFQMQVWEALRSIPYGQTRSYIQIACQIGNPKACRAVGMANNKNPILIAVPCHRVIGADGSLVGYAGGLELKKRLLGIEGSI